jgi:hypothetical protein
MSGDLYTKGKGLEEAGQLGIWSQGIKICYRSPPWLTVVALLCSVTLLYIKLVIHG